MRSVLIAMAVAAISVCPPPAAVAQAAGGQPATQSPVARTYTATGTLTDKARERLQKAFEKIDGVERVEFVPVKGSFTIRITGSVLPNAIMMAGMGAGFDFRAAPNRTFTAAGPTTDADLNRLRESLNKLPGMERVDVVQAASGATIRAQGSTKVGMLVATARVAGYKLKRAMTFVASGSPDAKDLARLREVLGKSNGVDKLEVNALGGGATLNISGGMDDDDLTDRAKSVGYVLKQVNTPTANRMFFVDGIFGDADEERLRKALESVAGIGEFRIMTSLEGSRLGVRGGTATPDKIMQAAKGAGFNLEAVDRPQAAGSEGERITPPAYGERISEDLTRVGDSAPDFSLVTKDGKGKISLANYRGKKPVVLIFGSYT